MAFPTIPTAAANTLLFSETGTASTTHTFPSLTTLNNASGDLLIAIIVQYNASSTTNTEFSSWGASFTEFGDSATATTAIAMGAAYKISDGTETGTFTVTSAGSFRSAQCLMSVKNWHGTTVPEIAFSAATTTTAQDPPDLNPAGWGTEDTLWIAVAGGGQTSLTGSWTGIGSAPANYSNYAEGAISGGDVIGACQIAVAFRQLNAANENPGSFTTDTSPEIERAATIAVRPAVTTVQGTAAAPLGALSGSATAVITRVATATAPLGALSATATAVITRTATASAPLGVLTGHADATVSPPPVEGTADAPLGALTATATAVITRVATGAADLGALTAAATATVETPTTPEPETPPPSYRFPRSEPPPVQARGAARLGRVTAHAIATRTHVDSEDDLFILELV